MTSVNRGHSTRPCATCDDDGWVEVWDDEGMEIVATHDCPHIDEPWHKPFNATGVLGQKNEPGEAR